MNIFDSLIGLDEYIVHLRKLGYDARRATAEERQGLHTGLLARDNHCICVQGRTFDMISLRTEGWVGPWDNLRLRSGTVSVGGVPLRSRTVLPLRTHYLVFCEPPQARADLAAELRLRTRGVVKRKVVGGSWAGQRLALRLNLDREAVKALRRLLGPSEKLEVIPEPAAGCVRIAHRAVRVLEFNLFKAGLVSFQQDLAPPELLRVLERVAGHVRDCLDETEMQAEL